MNEQLKKLLEAAGLGDFSQYFTGDLSQITELLGLKGDQSSQFGKFFQQFNPQSYLDAAGAASESRDVRSGMLSGRLGEQLSGLKRGTETGLEGSRDKFRELGATSGFGTGFGALQREAGESIEDIIQKSRTQQSGYQRQFQRGSIASEEQYGSERGAIYSDLQKWLSTVLGRGERLYGLDPLGGGRSGSGVGGYGPPDKYGGQGDIFV
jgi:hypothetical protein